MTISIIIARESAVIFSFLVSSIYTNLSNWLSLQSDWKLNKQIFTELILASCAKETKNAMNIFCAHSDSAISMNAKLIYFSIWICFSFFLFCKWISCFILSKIADYVRSEHPSTYIFFVRMCNIQCSLLIGAAVYTFTIEFHCGAQNALGKKKIHFAHSRCPPFWLFLFYFISLFLLSFRILSSRLRIHIFAGRHCRPKWPYAEY